MAKIIQDNELNSYKKAIEANCPITAGINRVLVIQVRPEYEKDVVQETQMPVVKNGSLWLPEHAAAATERAGGLSSKNSVVLAVIKSEGPSISEGRISFNKVYKENSLVYIFPNVFETIITIDGIDYMSYSSRDIVAGANNNELPE